MNEKRIKEIVEAVTEASKGACFARIDLTGADDELYALAAGINFLIDSFREKEEARRVTEARLIKLTDDAFWKSEELQAKNEEFEEYAKLLQSQKLEIEKRSAELSATNSRLQLEITERRCAEEALKKAGLQLVQSEKMASVGQLAAGVAHEINNPTGFVSSNLKTLSDYQKDLSRLIVEYRTLVSNLIDQPPVTGVPDMFAEQARAITAIESEIDIGFILKDIPDLIEESREGTERIKKIVMDLKDFAHPGVDKACEVDVNRGIESTLNVVWNELKYKATVTKELCDLPKIKGYPQQLNQVFMNILVNAAQAIPEKGELRIRTRASDGHVEIRIQDTGTGISPENLKKIFDPFFTTKEIGKGTGLGLHVVHSIVEKHRGTVEVTSEVGRGTTFTISLPVDFEAA